VKETFTDFLVSFKDTNHGYLKRDTLYVTMKIWHKKRFVIFTTSKNISQ